MLIDSDLSIVELGTFPHKDDTIDFFALAHKWATLGPLAFATIEEAFTPMRGGKSFQRGGKTTYVNYGRVVQSLALAAGFEPDQVPATVWQQVLVGVEAKPLPTLDPQAIRPIPKSEKAIKRRAYWKCAEMGWDIPFRSTHKKATPHDGLSDAACIALYGMKRWLKFNKNSAGNFHF